MQLSIFEKIVLWICKRNRNLKAHTMNGRFIAVIESGKGYALIIERSRQSKNIKFQTVYLDRIDEGTAHLVVSNHAHFKEDSRSLELSQGK